MLSLLFHMLLLCQTNWVSGQLTDEITSITMARETTAVPTSQVTSVTSENSTDVSTPGPGLDDLPDSSATCNFILYDGEGNFSSFSYPSPHGNDMDCIYRVRRTDDSCHLEVTFHDFDLEGNLTDLCLKDYLIINGKKYCGSSWKGKTELIPFRPELREISFLFHSNGEISGRGFWIEVKRLPGTCSLSSQDSCNKDFIGEEFNLLSPNFPGNYGDNQECFFLVIKHSEDVCGLELTFQGFDIEPSDNCSYDYLEINDKKLCGTINPGEVKNFVFTSEEMLIHFNSDDQNSRSGFNILAKQMVDCDSEQMETSTTSALSAPPPCHIISDAVSDEIVSPGYPLQYPENISCFYTLSKQDESYCNVELEFMDFDLEQSIGCMGDFLKIEGQRFCGTSLRGEKRNLPFDANGNAVLAFESDLTSVKPGFKIKFRQIPCSSQARLLATGGPPMLCGNIFEQQEFYLQSPNYPSNYSNNMDCQYVIRRKDVKICALEIRFNYFKIEASPDCSNDYFEIDEEKYCDQLPENTLKTYPFLTVDKVISFHSDAAVSGPGFFIHVMQQECDPRSAATANEECSQEVREEEFELKSPNYPNNYNNDLSCQYTIHRSSQSICELALNIQDFKLQEGEVCENDYLQIGEERLCGSINSGTIRTYNFGNQDKIFLNFESDGSKAEKGFSLVGKQRNCDATDQPPWITTTLWPMKPLWASTQAPNCDQIITMTQYILRSPEYPSNYPDNVDCQYQINRVSTRYCELEITISDLHIQVGDSCQFDHLEVDGHRFCGSTTAGNKRIFTFKTDRILINFHSDFSVNDRGFEVTLKQRECTTPSTTSKPSSKSCDDVFDSAEFTLTSPNFPDDYDSNLNCKFIIRRSDDNICKLEMLFLAFDVESSSECEYDYLLINGEKICGIMENVTRTYLFQDYEKVLTFHSDSGTSRPGFMIQVRQIECFTQTTEPPLPLKPCNKKFSSPAFEIRSDNYPSHYDPNLNCIYTIIPSSRDICSLDVTFIAFDVEASDGCQYDYLEIEGEKLCGVYPANLKRNIKVITQEVMFKFHSDGATSRPGFHLRVQQVDCSGIGSPESSATPPVSCDQKLSDRSGTFHSPRFPYNYPKNVRCTYVFVGKQDYCRVLLRFLEFSLHAENSVCEEDYLEVNGIKYCGPQLLEQTRTLTFYGSPREINITFRTDTEIEDKGFYATYRQLPCATPTARTHKPTKAPPPGTYVPSCDRLYASLKFKIISPDHPNDYPPEKECRYTIRRVSGKICKLRLTVVSFDVEPSEGCEYDYLEIENDKMCGTLPENSVREYDIQDYQTILKFHSDAANARSGFTIKVEQVECVPKPLPQQPSVFPPQRDAYPPFIQIEHTLEEDPFPYPPVVTLEDYDHLFEHPHHPSHHPSHPHKFPIAESSNRYDYRDCDRIFHKEEFEIRSVNFPSNYPNSLNCRYIIKKASPDICWVKLNFIRFDVETSPDCQYDYLSINSKRICGTLPDDEVQAYIFTSDELSLYFRSDGATSKRGFMIRGEQLPCSSKRSTTSKPAVPSVCDRKYDKDLFVIQSPNFPDEYPNSVDCRFTIKKANRYICGLELILLSFDIENDIDCEKDYLLIDGEKLCGPMPSKVTRRTPFLESEKNITFHTNGKIARPGFSILVRQVEDCDEDSRSVVPSEESCDQSFSSEKFVLQSVFFPEDYPPNITCHYTVNRYSSSVCSLQLSVLTFDVEEETDECNDYLEINPDRKLCGHLPKSHSESVPFIGGSLQLSFTSNFKIQKPGFSILAHQMTECAASRMPGVKGAPTRPRIPQDDTASSCDQTYSTKEFSIRTPNFPNDYPHDVTCKYTVVPASHDVCALELWFAHFDIEDGPECSYDYFDIGYKTVCGQLPSGFSRVIPFDTPSKLFVFHSDKGTSRTGFAIKIKQVTDCTSPRKPAMMPQQGCDQYLKENRGHVTSPSYPDDYQNNLRCSYHIEKAKGFCGLEIYFHDFHLEHSPDCSKDFLVIGEKPYCGLELKRKVKKLRFPAGDSSEIILKFHTNENGGATGFHVEYRQLPCRGHSGRQGRDQDDKVSQFPWSQSNGSFIPSTELSPARSDLHPVQLPFIQNTQSFPSYGYHPFHNTSFRKWP